MVLLAIILAWPISYLIGQFWLNNFAFKIEIQWWYFAMAGITALVIAWLTVGIRTFKAALTKPTNCLKEE